MEKQEMINIFNDEKAKREQLEVKRERMRTVIVLMIFATLIIISYFTYIQKKDELDYKAFQNEIISENYVKCVFILNDISEEYLNEQVNYPSEKELVLSGFAEQFDIYISALEMDDLIEVAEKLDGVLSNEAIINEKFRYCFSICREKAKYVEINENNTLQKLYDETFESVDNEGFINFVRECAAQDGVVLGE